MKYFLLGENFKKKKSKIKKKILFKSSLKFFFLQLTFKNRKMFFLEK